MLASLKNGYSWEILKDNTSIKLNIQGVFCKDIKRDYKYLKYKCQFLRLRSL